MQKARNCCFAFCLFALFFVLFCFVWEWVSSSLGWPWTCFVPEADYWTSDAPAFIFWVLIVKACTTISDFRLCGRSTQGFMIGVWGLCQGLPPEHLQHSDGYFLKGVCCVGRHVCSCSVSSCLISLRQDLSLNLERGPVTLLSLPHILA